MEVGNYEDVTILVTQDMDDTGKWVRAHREKVQGNGLYPGEKRVGCVIDAESW